MGYQINGMEIEDYIEQLNEYHFKQTIFGTGLAFFTGTFIGVIIGSR